VSDPSKPPAGTKGPGGTITVVAATALGVGGMMGAGLYTLLGLAAHSTGVLLPVAFLVAGVAAAFSVYSYSRLGATFPSSGGAAEFLVRSFGESTVAGGLNVFQFIGYLIATSLYAAGFAEYVGALAGDELPSWGSKAVGAAVVVVFTGVNLVSPTLVGRAATLIVGVESAILVGFVALGLVHTDPSRLTSQGMPGALGLVTGAALLYVTYQGFGVVANAAGRMSDPAKQLPRAMYAALGIVAAVYLIVSTLVVTLLPLSTIEADAGHALADAGRSVAGHVGFVVVASAAILATASAVNATIFAAASIGEDVARKGEITPVLTRTVMGGKPVALLVSAAVVIVLVLFFPLNAVGQMTSLAFLVIYGAVSLGHLRLRSQTGAKAWPLWAAVVINAALFLALLVDAVRTGTPATWITLVAALVGSFVFEALYRRRRNPTPAA
jgi:amino acid transporter